MAENPPDVYVEPPAVEVRTAALRVCMYVCMYVIYVSVFGSGYLEVMTPSEIEDLKNNNNIFKAKRKVHYVFEDSYDIERCRCIHTYMIEHACMHTYIHTYIHT